MNELGSPRYSIIAIISFIFAFLFPPLGIVLGIIALNKIKKDSNLKGKGVSVAALSVGIFIIICFTLLYALLYMSSPMAMAPHNIKKFCRNVDDVEVDIKDICYKGNYLNVEYKVISDNNNITGISLVSYFISNNENTYNVEVSLNTPAIFSTHFGHGFEGEVIDSIEIFPFVSIETSDGGKITGPCPNPIETIDDILECP